ncbi:hypothetical protein ACF0H5_007589 [Mactra antiquata]
MENEVRIRKKGKKSKILPVYNNDSFEMGEASESVKEKVSPFLNEIREQLKNNNAKSNALEHLVDAKLHASKWRDFVNSKRKRKKTSMYNLSEFCLLMPPCLLPGNKSREPD